MAFSKHLDLECLPLDEHVVAVEVLNIVCRIPSIPESEIVLKNIRRN